MTDLERHIREWQDFAVNYAFKVWPYHFHRPKRDANPFRDDIISCALEALWKALVTHDCERMTSPYSLIMTMVHNAVIDLYRRECVAKRKRPTSLAIPISTLDGFDARAKSPTADELAVREILTILPPLDREVLQRTIMFPEDHREVQRDLGCKKVSLWGKKKKALARARELLEAN